MALDSSSPTSLRASDDLALVQGVVDRRPEALAELYDRYAPLLLAVTRRILTVPVEAEEALQQTFHLVWNQAGRFDSGTLSVSSWLVLVARERALDRLRRRRREGRSDDRSGADRSAETLPGVHVEGVAVKARRLRVEEALSRLSAEDKEILELAFFDGLSIPEMAARLRSPLVEVRARALLAMKQLRRNLRSEIRELM